MKALGPFGCQGFNVSKRQADLQLCVDQTRTNCAKCLGALRVKRTFCHCFWLFSYWKRSSKFRKMTKNDEKCKDLLICDSMSNTPQTSGNYSLDVVPLEAHDASCALLGKLNHDALRVIRLEHQARSQTLVPS